MSDLCPEINWTALRLGALAAAHRAENTEAVSKVDGQEDAMLLTPPWRRAATLEREARLREASRRAA
jgi:hypothetical protein